MIVWVHWDYLIQQFFRSSDFTESLSEDQFLSRTFNSLVKW